MVYYLYRVSPAATVVLFDLRNRAAVGALSERRNNEPEAIDAEEVEPNIPFDSPLVQGQGDGNAKGGNREVPRLSR